MTLWLATLGMAVVTFALRGSFLVLPERVALPALLRRSLRFVPAAVLTAIYAPELFLQHGVQLAPLPNAKLLAGAVAIAAAWRFRLTFVTIACGIAALHLFERLL